MNQSFYGSICVSDLIEKIKEKHSSFIKAQNGKIYCNITVWLNEEEDKFGNVLSIQSNPHKDKKDQEQKFYLGNCKKSEGPKPLADGKTAASIVSEFTDAISDLPF